MNNEMDLWELLRYSPETGELLAALDGIADLVMAEAVRGP